jgi:hypothetical protein
MALEYANINNAMGAVTATTSGAGNKPVFSDPSPGFNPNGVGADHSVVGIYDVVLDTPLAAGSQAICIASPRSAAPNASCSVSHVSDTVKRVTTSLGGVADDTVSFDLVVLQRA